MSAPKKRTMTLTDAIDLLLTYLATGKAALTLRTYRNGLRAFAQFAGAESSAERITVEQVIAFAESLSAKSPATRANYLAAVNRLCRYLIENKYLAMDASEIMRLKTTIHDMKLRVAGLPHPASASAINALLQAAGETERVSDKVSEDDKRRAYLRQLRNIALVHALRSSGMRIGEAIALKRGDLHERAAVVIGKWSKSRMVYFDDAAWDAIQAYLRERHDGARGSALYTLPVFARHDRGAGSKAKSLTRWGVERLVQEWRTAAKIEEPLTPHSLRHAFATRLYEHTDDIALVQEALGHSSPVTTRIYARVSPKRVRDAHRAAFGN